MPKSAQLTSAHAHLAGDDALHAASLRPGAGGSIATSHFDAENKASMKQLKSRILAASYSTQGADFKSFFEKIDTNGDGTVDSAELLAFLQKLLPGQITQKQLQSMLKQMDADGNGEIDQSEFSSFMAPEEYQKRAARDRNAPAHVDGEPHFTFQQQHMASDGPSAQFAAGLRQDKINDIVHLQRAAPVAGIETVLWHLRAACVAGKTVNDVQKAPRQIAAEMFKTWDVNGDGYLSGTELEAAVAGMIDPAAKAAGKPPRLTTGLSDKDWMQLLRRMGATKIDGEMRVGVQQFAGWATVISRSANTSSRSRMMFKIAPPKKRSIDTFRDKKMKQREIRARKLHRRVLTAAYEYSGNQLLELFRAADVNSDGRLNEAEVEKLVRGDLGGKATRRDTGQEIQEGDLRWLLQKLESFESKDNDGEYSIDFEDFTRFLTVTTSTLEKEAEKRKEMKKLESESSAIVTMGQFGRGKTPQSAESDSVFNDSFAQEGQRRRKRVTVRHARDDDTLDVVNYESFMSFLETEQAMTFGDEVEESREGNRVNKTRVELERSVGGGMVGSKRATLTHAQAHLLGGGGDANCGTHAASLRGDIRVSKQRSPRSSRRKQAELEDWNTRAEELKRLDREGKRLIQRDRDAGELGSRKDSTQDIDENWEKFNHGGNRDDRKTLSWEELRVLKSRLLAASYTGGGSNLYMLFSKYDINRDGVLSEEELFRALSGQFPGLLGRRQLAMLLNMMKSTGASRADSRPKYRVNTKGALVEEEEEEDGCVNYQEFEAFIRSKDPMPRTQGKPETTLDANKFDLRLTSQVAHIASLQGAQHAASLRAGTAEQSQVRIAKSGGGKTAKEMKPEEVNLLKKKLVAASYAAGGSDLYTLFARIDKDHNGLLDYEEMFSVVQKIVPDIVTKPQFKRLLQQIDVDGDGTVDYDEFSSWLLRRQGPKAERKWEGQQSPTGGVSGQRHFMGGVGGQGVQAADDAKSGAFVGGLRRKNSGGVADAEAMRRRGEKTTAEQQIVSLRKQYREKEKRLKQQWEDRAHSRKSAREDKGLGPMLAGGRKNRHTDLEPEQLQPRGGKRYNGQAKPPKELKGSSTGKPKSPRKLRVPPRMTRQQGVHSNGHFIPYSGGASKVQSRARHAEDTAAEPITTSKGRKLSNTMVTNLLRKAHGIMHKNRYACGKLSSALAKNGQGQLVHVMVKPARSPRNRHYRGQGGKHRGGDSSRDLAARVKGRVRVRVVAVPPDPREGEPDDTPYCHATLGVREFLGYEGVAMMPLGPPTAPPEEEQEEEEALAEQEAASKKSKKNKKAKKQRKLSRRRSLRDVSTNEELEPARKKAEWVPCLYDEEQYVVLLDNSSPRSPRSPGSPRGARHNKHKSASNEPKQSIKLWGWELEVVGAEDPVEEESDSEDETVVTVDDTPKVEWWQKIVKDAGGVVPATSVVGGAPVLPPRAHGREGSEAVLRARVARDTLYKKHDDDAPQTYSHPLGGPRRWGYAEQQAYERNVTNRQQQRDAFFRIFQACAETLEWTAADQEMFDDDSDAGDMPFEEEWEENVPIYEGTTFITESQASGEAKPVQNLEFNFGTQAVTYTTIPDIKLDDLSSRTVTKASPSDLNSDFDLGVLELGVSRASKPAVSRPVHGMDEEWYRAPRQDTTTDDKSLPGFDAAAALAPERSEAECAEGDVGDAGDAGDAKRPDSARHEYVRGCLESRLLVEPLGGLMPASGGGRLWQDEDGQGGGGEAGGGQGKGGGAIRLGHFAVGDERAELLGLALRLQQGPQVESCDLSSNRLSERGAAQLLRFMPSTLTSLDLSRNSVGFEGVRSLCSCLPTPLTALDLSKNGLEDDAVVLLCAAIGKWCKGEVLEGLLDEDDFKTTAAVSPSLSATAKAQAAQHLPFFQLAGTRYRLARLELSHNQIAGEGAGALATLLEEQPAVTAELGLAWNQVGGAHDGVVAFMAALETCSLRALDLSWNPIAFDPRASNRVAMPIPSWVVGEAGGQQQWEEQVLRKWTRHEGEMARKAARAREEEKFKELAASAEEVAESKEEPAAAVEGEETVEAAEVAEEPPQQPPAEEPEEPLPSIDLSEETDVLVTPAIAALVTSLAGNTSLTLLHMAHTQLTAPALSLVGHALLSNTSLLHLGVGGDPARDLVEGQSAPGKSAIEESRAYKAALVQQQAGARSGSGDRDVPAGAATEAAKEQAGAGQAHSGPAASLIPVQALKGEVADDGFSDVEAVALGNRGLDVADAAVISVLIASNEQLKRLELQNNKVGGQGALQLGRALMANRMCDAETQLEWIALGENEIGPEQERRMKAICHCVDNPPGEVDDDAEEAVPLVVDMDFAGPTLHSITGVLLS